MLYWWNCYLWKNSIIINQQLSEHVIWRIWDRLMKNDRQSDRFQKRLWPHHDYQRAFSRCTATLSGCSVWTRPRVVCSAIDTYCIHTIEARFKRIVLTNRLIKLASVSFNSHFLMHLFILPNIRALLNWALTINKNQRIGLPLHLSSKLLHSSNALLSRSLWRIAFTSNTLQ